MNISSNEKGLGGALTNPTELAKSKGNLKNSYPITFLGIKYVDSEQAYQDNKLNQDDFDYALMVDILVCKLEQYPMLIDGIKKRGGLPFISECSHFVFPSYDKRSRWTGQGQESLFIKALTEAYKKI